MIQLVRPLQPCRKLEHLQLVGCANHIWVHEAQRDTALIGHITPSHLPHQTTPLPMATTPSHGHYTLPWPHPPMATTPSHGHHTLPWPPHPPMATTPSHGHHTLPWPPHPPMATTPSHGHHTLPWPPHPPMATTPSHGHHTSHGHDTLPWPHPPMATTPSYPTIPQLHVNRWQLQRLFPPMAQPLHEVMTSQPMESHQHDTCAT